MSDFKHLPLDRGQGDLLTLIGIEPEQATPCQLADVISITRHPRFDRASAVARLNVPVYGTPHRKR